jgi:enoyl-CoA hydratase/carnithine racemase
MAPTTTEIPNYKDLVAEAQQQALASIKQAQDFYLRATEIAVGLVPTDPTFGLTAKVPTAKEVVESSFAFTGKVFDAQKTYSLKLAEILDTAGAKATPKA